jgi:L-ascorbate metabolism protein UlaG (beta-lactamase superfamily)
MKIQDIELDWLKHSCFEIKFKNKIIFIDPFHLETSDKADIILITHGHYDHCSLQDIEKIAKDGTIIICTADCQSKVTRIQKKIEIILSEPGKEISMENIKIKSIPAYNINKQFHPKNEGWVGYIIQLGSVVIYHAGDTDLIKEMSDLVGYGKKGNYFIALLPIGGTYTMDAVEAAKAASIIHPSLAVPMHYGSSTETKLGSEEDAKKFIGLCKENKIDAQIL